MSADNQENEWSLHFAKSLNSLAWRFLEQTRRSKEDIEMMVHAAHGSCFHWLQLGKRVNNQRALWLLSRVYSVAQEPRQSLKFAGQCLELTLKYPREMEDFDIAYAYEAQARASYLNKRSGDGNRFLVLAKEAGEKIKKSEDKKLFFSDLKFEGLLK